MRHNSVRNIIGNLGKAAGLNPTLEKPGLLPPSPECLDPGGRNLRRPADVFLPNWVGGGPAALDLAITSPHRQESWAQVPTRSGVAAEAYEAYKRSYLNTAQLCLHQGLSFVPLVAETTGGWGPSGMCTIKAMARAAAARSGSDEHIVRELWLQKLSVAMRRANGRAILRRDAAAFEDGDAQRSVTEAAVILAGG